MGTSLENHGSAENNSDNAISSMFTVAATPFSPTFFIGSPEPYYPILESLEIQTSAAAAEQMPGTDPNITFGQNATDQDNSEFHSLFSQFFGEPEINFPKDVQEHGAEGSSARSDQSFITQATPNFSDVPMQGRTLTCTPPAVQNNQQTGTINQQFQSEQANLVDSSLSAFEFPNDFQIEHHPLTRQMDQPNPYSTMYGDRVLQNFPTSDCSENNQQAVPNPVLPFQNSTADGIHGNSQLQQQNPLHMPYSSPRPQHYTAYQPDECPLAPSLRDQQGSGSFLTASTLSRPLQSSYQREFNHFASRSSLLGSQEHISLQMARDSAFSRFQPISGRNHLDPVLQPRRPWLHDYGQLNQVPTKPSLLNPLHSISLPSEPPRLYSSTRLQSMTSLMNQPNRASALYPGRSSLYQSSIVNSSASQETRSCLTGPSLADNNFGALPTNYLERRRQRCNAREQLKIGQFTKRAKKEMMQTAAEQEENPILESTKTSQSQGNETANSSGPSGSANPSVRPAKNAIYDPLFEGIGLPVDPHLRLFATP